MPERVPSSVSIVDAWKRYGQESPVLEGISIEAAPSDFISIIGPSGCGKTTLLRLLAGLVPPDRGEILIDRLDPDHAAHEVSYVFQDPTLLPWLTVAQNISLPHRLARLDRQVSAERLASSLRLVRLEGLEKRYPRQLSGGQRMRVSLARALSMEPRLLLMDEPFGALDEMSREQLNEELLAIRQARPWTVFFVTHSVSEAVFLSNRLVIMSAKPGRIKHLVDIPLPYPRTAETRQSSQYQKLVAYVSGLLRSAEEVAP